MTNTRSPYGTALSWAAAVCFGLVVTSATPQENVRARSLIGTSLWVTGDLVYRREPGWVSTAAAAGNESGSPASHVGLIEKDESGLWVWHAAAPEGANLGGVHREPLHVFFARSSLVQHQGTGMTLEPHEVAAVVRYLNSVEGLRFDSKFDTTTPSEIYCTELVLRTFASAGRQLAAKEAVFEIPISGRLQVVTVEEIQRVATELAPVSTH